MGPDVVARECLDVWLEQVRAALYRRAHSILRVLLVWERGTLRRSAPEVRALAFVIAKNLALDRVRRRKIESDRGSYGVSSGPPEHDKRDCLLSEVIYMTLRRLPNHQRQAWMMREIDGLSDARIARRFRMRTETLKTWRYRDRRRLANLLAREYSHVR